MGLRRKTLLALNRDLTAQLAAQDTISRKTLKARLKETTKELELSKKAHAASEKSIELLLDETMRLKKDVADLKDKLLETTG